MRDLDSIDADLTCERAILVMERRAGHDCRAATATSARIDELLDERSAVVRALQHDAPGAVDGRLVRGEA